MLSNLLSWRIREIRSLSVLFILACHIFQFHDIYAQNFFNIGAQIFFIISGFLYAETNLTFNHQWYIRRLIKIIIPYLIVTTLIIASNLLIQDDWININKILKAFLGMGGISGTGHLWFVPVIVICYLLLPILQKVNKKTLYYMSIAIAFIMAQYSSRIICLMLFIIAFSGHQFKYSKWSKVVFMLIPIMLLIIGLPNEYIYNISHFIYSLSIFFLLLSIKLPFSRNEKYRKAISFIDKNSYWIYLIHPLFIGGPFNLLNSNLNILSYNALLKLLLSLLIIGLLSNMLRAGYNSICSIFTNKIS